ncbi:Cell division trigger factor [Patulibacter medicamentivorans]|uniref:Trigger factor n=1 Tax=Patulibacter medicamentivorans TaxID=1097667 RepID=H0E8I8_9ACTN|nr:trigger factor [Patulibacter medicamentivorans]EHN09988.1 Cell division trigger factor [Patulibacter medicamentivorans]
MSTVTTTVTELPESRVKVEAEVTPKALEQALLETAKVLSRDLRVPGFRKGKVPPPVVLRRYGREAVLDEALRRSMGEWLAAAVEDAKLSTVGEPSVNIGSAPKAGEGVKFDFEIGVRPAAKLGDTKKIEVGRREAVASDERVDADLEQLRERHAKLEPVDRPAAEGDTVLVSFVGRIDGEEFEGGAGRDQLIELGSGRLIPGFEDQLQGAVKDEERDVRVNFPDDYGAEHLQGAEAVFAVTVHEVQERKLPELDDSFAEEAAGADSLAELRDEIAERLKEQDEASIESQFREAVIDTLTLAAEVEVPDSLAEARAGELLERTLHQLSHQGISRELYFQMAGKTEAELVAEARPEAARSLRREAAVNAYVEAEGIDPAEGDLLDAITGPAAQQGTTPEKLLKRLTNQGHLDELKSDVAEQQAIERLVEGATAVSVEDAKAKGLLWTPIPGDEEDTGGRPWVAEERAARAAAEASEDEGSKD